MPQEYIVYLKTDDQVRDILPELRLEYTAIFGYSDLPIIHAYNTLMEMDVKVPSQVALFGYGNFKFSQLLKTSLSTVALHVYQMGKLAVKMLVKNIESKVSMKNIILDVQLRERESVSQLI